MELVPGFTALLQPFALSMTTPTFESFATVVTGWVLASRRTVTRMILAAGDSADKHYSSYHRVFSAARWSLDRVGLAVQDLVTRWVEGDVLVALDDTLARKRGLKMFGCGMHHDPLISTRSKAVTSRLLLDARLYEAPPERKPGTNKGRPRKRGRLLPTPAAMLETRCRRVAFNIYGRSETARVADCEARVHKAPERPLRIVAVQPLTGGRKPQAFYSTRHDATAEAVIAWYASRWSVEVTFHDSKQHLGFEEPQGWSRQAVQRTAPVAMLLYSLIVLWFVEEGPRSYQTLDCPWYTSKAQPSFADMLATLRRRCVREKLLSLALRGPGSRKVQRLLENAYANAA